MTFASPLILLALLLVPVAIARYVSGERARRRRAKEFASPRLMKSIAPLQPGWRRHVPLALYAVALAVLIVAAARPRTTVAVPVEQATVMLLTDVSGSMQATDVRPSRLAAAREAARTFVGKVPHGVRIGVMAFNQHPRTLQPPTGDHGAARDALAQLASSGGTRTGDALDSALTVLERQPGVNGKRPPAAIVLLSDGKSTAGEDPILLAQRAQRDHIPIYTVALGTASGTIRVPRPGGASGLETRPVPPDPQTLSEIARISGGQAYSAEDENQLSTVYHHLGSQLGRKKAPREITAGFVGGAVALLALAGALSLRWFGRLP
jgi:Ca-activated chloride channel family protein